MSSYERWLAMALSKRLSFNRRSRPRGRRAVRTGAGCGGRVGFLQEGAAVDKFEYFTGIPEVGIVPRAPHAGPLLRHVYEQELGRGGFAGKVTHTYHLYPPNNWLPDETGTLAGAAWAPHWDSPLRDVGGTHHALGRVEPSSTGDVYRGMARLIVNATVAMNVTAPGASMDYFFEHHGATLIFFIHEGTGTLETLLGPIAYRRG